MTSDVDVSVFKLINEMKVELLTLYEKLAGIESIFEEIIYDNDEHIGEGLISARIVPLVFEGGFTANVPDIETDIIELENTSTGTYHFTGSVLHDLGVDNSAKPFVFGRILDFNGQKLEGTFRVVIIKGDEELEVLNATTEKLNFSHPMKPQNRLYIDTLNAAPFEPGDKLVIKLKTKSGLDTEGSKIAFEDIIVLESIQ